MLRIFIGYDKHEAVAYHVLAHSILTRSSIPVSITPLNRDSMRGFFVRERGQYDSTDFSISRFLVPYLCGYEGFAVFMDCDMLCLTDMAQLTGYMTLMDRYNFAVRVVKHEHKATTERKFLDQVQTQYTRKNWSSLMVFNNALCHALTPEYVNNAPGLAMHQFNWCPDHQIASLEPEWNWLVEEMGDRKPQGEFPHILHYTKGTPCFPEYANCEYADLWHGERVHMNGG